MMSATVEAGRPKYGASRKSMIAVGVLLVVVFWYVTVSPWRVESVLDYLTRTEGNVPVVPPSQLPEDLSEPLMYFSEPSVTASPATSNDKPLASTSAPSLSLSVPPSLSPTSIIVPIEVTNVNKSSHYELIDLAENRTLTSIAAPLLRAVNMTDAKIAKCIESKRMVDFQSKGLLCEGEHEATSIYPDHLDPMMRNPNYLKFRGRNATVLQDTNWGGTCNKMEILAGAVWRMNSNTNDSEADRNMLALGPIFSDLAWSLDLRLLSRDFPLLLDCSSCDEDYDRAIAIHCRTIVVDGSLVNITADGLFHVTNRYWAVDLYWNNGPSAMGFQSALAFNLLPPSALRSSIERAWAKIPRKAATIGVHRRGMDDQCYEWLGIGRGEYECHRDGAAWGQVDALAQIGVREKLKNNVSLSAFEAEHPLLMTCNYTLGKRQLSILKTEWSALKQDSKPKPHLLLSSDGMDPKGDTLLSESALFSKTIRVQDLNPKANCSKSRHTGILADMVSDSLTE